MHMAINYCGLHIFFCYELIVLRSGSYEMFPHLVASTTTYHAGLFAGQGLIDILNWLLYKIHIGIINNEMFHCIPLLILCTCSLCCIVFVLVRYINVAICNNIIDENFNGSLSHYNL